MPEGEKELAEKVAAWVETSGRALEMRVARIFTRRGATVGQSRMYLDADGTQREADVVATWDTMITGGKFLSVTVVAECKSSQKSPWVLFDDGRSVFPMAPFKVTDLLLTHEALTGPRGSLQDVDQAWHRVHPGSDEVLGVEPAAHSLVTALEKDQSNQPNSAWRATRQVLSACRGILPDLVDSVDTRRWALVIPLIVTAAPLFRVHLDGDGEAVTEPVHKGILITAPPDSHTLRAVFVTNERYLRYRLAEALDVFARALAQAR